MLSSAPSKTRANETIAALATAPGIASVAIVRVSGEKALSIAGHLTRGKTLEPRYAHLAKLFGKTGELIDEGIVIYFKAPYSFTREDIVEFQCHGGMIVAEQILDAVLHCGARPAKPGEYTKRAFLSGRIDLTEAEAVAKLIEAKSEDAARMLARQLDGELAGYVETVRDRLIGMTAHAEVAIDYAEEDLPATLVETMAKVLEKTKEELGRLLRSSRRRKGLIEGFKIAIVGKPNVGKSSILNRLVSYERAIVSDIAGTTRDTIEEQIRIGTHLVRIVDTAGIRQADNVIEQIGVQRSRKAISEADLVLAVFDVNQPWEQEDDAIVETLESSAGQKPVLALLNKADLPHGLSKERLKCYPTLLCSAKSEIETLIIHLEEMLASIAGGDEMMLVNNRQIVAVEEAVRAIDEALIPFRSGELEFFSFHLQSAIQAIGSLSRPVQAYEILDKMFSEFCLGK